MTPITKTHPHPLSGPRIVVVGATGSGKTTLSARLARALGVPHLELDAVHWQPNWEMMETGAFRRRVEELTQAGAWVADGNYSKARDILWSRASALVWLDYPLLFIFWRLFSRSVRRLLRREELWNGNRETWKGMFFSKESLFVWLAQSYPKMRRTYPELLAQPENAHLRVIRLRSARETEQFAAQVEKDPRLLAG